MAIERYSNNNLEKTKVKASFLSHIIVSYIPINSHYKKTITAIDLAKYVKLYIDDGNEEIYYGLYCYTGKSTFLFALGAFNSRLARIAPVIPNAPAVQNPQSSPTVSLKKPTITGPIDIPRL